MTPTRSWPRIAAATAVLVGSLAASVNAAVRTGAITDWPESVNPFYWGDGVHDLYHSWSVQTVLPEGAGTNIGYFYPASYAFSSADVYVFGPLADIATVTDAAAFPYVTNDSVEAGEGDTVFFRGANGYYGAWRIDDIRVISGAAVYPYANLSGQWYFQDNGTANFGVPEPATRLLAVAGLAGSACLRRRRLRRRSGAG